MKIVEEIQRQISELGSDGRLVKMQLEELIGGLEKEENLIIKIIWYQEKVKTQKNSRNNNRKLRKPRL